MEVKTPVREKKRLLEKLSDYLKSNCYMYAPLITPLQSIIPPKGTPPTFIFIHTIAVHVRFLRVGPFVFFANSSRHNCS